MKYFALIGSFLVISAFTVFIAIFIASKEIVSKYLWNHKDAVEYIILDEATFSAKVEQDLREYARSEDKKAEAYLKEARKALLKEKQEWVKINNGKALVVYFDPFQYNLKGELCFDQGLDPYLHNSKVQPDDFKYVYVVEGIITKDLQYIYCDSLVPEVGDVREVYQDDVFLRLK